ncbi:hypothetical protein [Eubacterium sp. F2]|uniref:hypothetical protein n=1 Tax=Eubacterium sp. F2 TaxID=3381348 RepID=UPI0039082797
MEKKRLFHSRIRTALLTTTLAVVLVMCFTAVHAHASTENQHASYKKLIHEYHLALAGKKINRSVITPAQSGLETGGICHWKGSRLIIPKPVSANKPRLAYTYVDIDHDGQDEIVFSQMPSSTDPGCLNSLWTVKSGKAVPVIHSTYRNPFEILSKKGYLMKEQSGGVDTIYTSFYRLSNGKLTKVCVAKKDGNHFHKNSRKISRTAYKKLMKKYGHPRTISSGWTRVK